MRITQLKTISEMFNACNFLKELIENRTNKQLLQITVVFLIGVKPIK